MQNIFSELKTANQVGNLVASMQTPDLDETVLKQAIDGTANSSDVVLEMFQSGSTDEIRKYTVAELQNAKHEDNKTWLLTTGETLWIF